MKGQEQAEKETSVIWKWFEKFNLRHSRLQHISDFHAVKASTAQKFDPKGCVVFFFDYKGNTCAQAYGCYSVNGIATTLAMMKKMTHGKDELHYEE